MKTLRSMALPTSCVLFAVTIASAQMGMGMRQAPIPSGVFNPVVGSGAAYDISTSQGRSMTVEFAIVGKETVNGKGGYWMEWTMPAMGGEMIMKTLTVASDTVVISRTIMQMPGRPPMEMPQQMMGRTTSQTVLPDIRSAAEDVGSESITVPAGTFTCEHYRMKDGSGDTWLSTKVPPFGVVKHQGKDSTMVLARVITGAKDKIIGTPQPFNPMGMMQQPSQP